MKTYGEFSPTSMDAAGLGLPERQDWLVAPVGQTRDSGALERSNFRTALRLMGGESETVEVHRFGHWGPGWYEIILIAPGSPAVAVAEEIESALEDYPVLSDEDFSELELEEYVSTWDSYGYRDYVKELKRHHGLSINAEFLLMDVPPEILRETYESAIPSGDYYCDGNLRTEWAAESTLRAAVAALLRTARQVAKECAAA